MSENLNLPWTSRVDTENQTELHKVSDCDGFDVAMYVDEPNAAFIVRAANCHDELVAACQSQLRLIDFIQRLLACYRTGSRPSEKILDEVGKAGDVEMQAKAALAKAAPGEP